MDIFRDSWLPTDAGILSPIDALTKATRFAWARPDWNAASLLFLHAILQTAVVNNKSCGDRDEWFSLLNTPPINLADWLAGFDGGSAPYQCQKVDKKKPVASVLPETPGESTLDKVSDILTWHEQSIVAMTIPEAQIAIMSDQLWGVPGGRGYYEGCRGRRPLTIMVEPLAPNALLWQRVWLNVMPRDRWVDAYGDKPNFDFPWKQEIPDVESTPENTHPLEMLWQTSRRWRMVIGDDDLVREMLTQGEGRQYKGWNHPLTPYFVTGKNEWVAFKSSPHVGFNDWAGIAYGLKDKTRRPKALAEYIEDVHSGSLPIRLRCFGHSLGDADAPGAWSENVVPFYCGVDHGALEAAIAQAEETRSRLAGFLKGVKPFLANRADQLYSLTEASFFERVTSNNWDGWDQTLRKAANKVYWDTALTHGAGLLQVAQSAKQLLYPAMRKAKNKSITLTSPE